MKSPAQFPGVLTDVIITRGAPTKLISDSAHVETSKEVRGILRTYSISSWQSEPPQQHQNPAERRYQTVKRLCNTILDQTGTSAYCWLLCLMYVCFVLNNAFSEVIQSTPLRQAYGTNNDISPMLYFLFYEPVYYLVDETTFPSESKELCRRRVGVSENVGHFMTYKILTDDTRRIIHRSNIRSVADPNARILCLDPLNDEPPEVGLLLLQIMGRISHFTLWNLLMNILIRNPHLTHLNILPLETTHKNCSDAPSSWTLRRSEVPCPHCRMHFRPRVQRPPFRRSCHVSNFCQ
jgi:hypothetical protein